MRKSTIMIDQINALIEIERNLPQSLKLQNEAMTGRCDRDNRRLEYIPECTAAYACVTRAPRAHYLSGTNAFRSCGPGPNAHRYPYELTLILTITPTVQYLASTQYFASKTYIIFWKQQHNIGVKKQIGQGAQYLTSELTASRPILRGHENPPFLGGNVVAAKSTERGRTPLLLAMVPCSWHLQMRNLLRIRITANTFHLIRS